MRELDLTRGTCGLSYGQSPLAEALQRDPITFSSSSLSQITTKASTSRSPSNSSSTQDTLLTKCSTTATFINPRSLPLRIPGGFCVPARPLLLHLCIKRCRICSNLFHLHHLVHSRGSDVYYCLTCIPTYVSSHRARFVRRRWGLENQPLPENVLPEEIPVMNVFTWFGVPVHWDVNQAMWMFTPKKMVEECTIKGWEKMMMNKNKKPVEEKISRTSPAWTPYMTSRCSITGKRLDNVVAYIDGVWDALPKELVEQCARSLDASYPPKTCREDAERLVGCAKKLRERSSHEVARLLKLVEKGLFDRVVWEALSARLDELEDAGVFGRLKVAVAKCKNVIAGWRIRTGWD
ncbi:hypothetical protein EX30DRAFT_341756 [Ascodesmis nigricans]|uniref:Uncharacterized protein n=1 Tax=Ascodesmis nigricans TaxID=341454 RepID=A0A4S2MUL8_9PEZI|nr:hypothetical protein EX30DRAFT_341756 [Ascodesmis nigricans]